jgi:L-threonylcarbamoyladenylate synthase
VLADDGTIGVRVPDHSVALAIANRCGGSMAVTSANPSGGPPALRAEDIQATLGEVIDIVLDGGRVRLGVASTVVRIGDDDAIEIIRQGTVTREAIESEWEAIRTGS